jgi:hypothetical protein
MAEPDPDLSLTWDQVLAWRLGQQVLQRPRPDPVGVVSALGGVQAQVASSALQAVAIRSRALPDLDRLLYEEKALVKTWAMRGTLHLLPASELPIWFGMLRRRPWKITPAWERYHGITSKQLDSITETIPEVLSAEPVTREELTETVVSKTGDPNLGEVMKSGWGQVLKPAANRGLLAQGPPRGRNVTFVDPAAWLGYPIDEVGPEDATAGVLARFLDANGPASVTDFGRWLGVDPKTARELMAPHLDSLVAVSTEGHVGWLTSDGAKAAAKTAMAESAQLLPGFDPYTLAPLSHREFIIPEGRVGEVSRAAGWIAPVILDRGRIVGTWEVDKEAGVVLVPFDTMTRKTVASLREHVETRYQGLLGEHPRVSPGQAK